MKKRLCVLTLLLVALLAISAVRALVGGGSDGLESSCARRYMVCAECGAEYDVAADYLANLSPEDVGHSDTCVLARCHECGKIAATPRYLIGMDGEIVSEAGAPDTDRGSGLR